MRRRENRMSDTAKDFIRREVGNLLREHDGNLPAFLTIATNIAGQATTTTDTDTNAPGPGPFFYRVSVQP